MKTLKDMMNDHINRHRYKNYGEHVTYDRKTTYEYLIIHKNDIKFMITRMSESCDDVELYIDGDKILDIDIYTFPKVNKFVIRGMRLNHTVLVIFNDYNGLNICYTKKESLEPFLYLEIEYYIQKTISTNLQRLNILFEDLFSIKNTLLIFFILICDTISLTYILIAYIVILSTMVMMCFKCMFDKCIIKLYNRDNKKTLFKDYTFPLILFFISPIVSIYITLIFEDDIKYFYVITQEYIKTLF